MRHDRADQDLQQQHRGDDQEILADAPLARRQRREPGEDRVHRRPVGIVEKALIDVQDRAEGEEREAEADPGPAEGVYRRGVADERLERPVLRPRHGAAGALRHRRQRRIDQEIGGLGGALRVEAVGRGPALGEIVAQQRGGDLAAQALDRRRQRRRHGHHRPGQVEAAQFRLHPGPRRGGLAARGEVRLGQLGEPDQIGGGVILAEIRAHAVEAAVIHQVGLLKPGLAGDDVGARHQRRAVGRDQLLGNRRRRLVGELRRPAEQGEGRHRDRQQQPFQNVGYRVLADTLAHLDPPDQNHP